MQDGTRQIMDTLARLEAGVRSPQASLQKVADAWHCATQPRGHRSCLRRLTWLAAEPTAGGARIVARYADHPDPNVRLAALRALEKAGLLASAHVDVIDFCTDDLSVPVQLQAVRALVAAGATAQLIKLLDGEIWSKGWIACQGLAVSHRVLVIDHLRARQRAHYNWVRAARALDPVPLDLRASLDEAFL